MKNEISEFLRYALEKGKIKPLSDAFLEYPVENEEHKGKIEYFVNENIMKYEKYAIGDIVFVREYIYNDGNLGNNHLFVIIDEASIMVPIEYFGMLISSNIDKLKFNTNILLSKNSQNNLRTDSIVKTDILYQIKDENILFKIGTVNIDTVEIYKKAYIELNNKI